MYLPKRLLLLILLPVLLSTVHLNSIAQSNNPVIKQLNERMKMINHRIEAYRKCFKYTCTPQERRAAAQLIGRDAAILVGTILALGTGIYLGKKYGWDKFKQRNEEKARERYASTKRLLLEANETYGEAYKEYKKNEIEYGRLLKKDPNEMQEATKEAKKKMDEAFKKYKALEPDVQLEEAKLNNILKRYPTLQVD